MKGQNVTTTLCDSPNGGRGSVCDSNKVTCPPHMTGSPPGMEEDGRKNYHHRNMHSRATKHVVKMLIAVVVAFFICWAPFHAQRLLAIHASSALTPDIIAVYTALTYLSGVLYYLSTCINPLLYNIMSNKFRNAFRETLSRYFGVGSRQRKPVRRYSTLSLPRSVSPTRSQSLSHSHSHSHSGGNGSRQTSLRYLEGDMSRRPLVVSFRRPKASTSYVCIHSTNCRCSRSADVRRAVYTARVANQSEEEEQSNRKLLKKYGLKNKSKKFKRWGRKKRDAYLYGGDSCKIVCSECHRYLSDGEVDKEKKKIVLIGGATVIQDKELLEQCDACNGIKPLATVESDLIPRHRCPNSQFSDIQEKSDVSNASVGACKQIFHENLDSSKKYQPLSKTMPDIVYYTNHSRHEPCDIQQGADGSIPGKCVGKICNGKCRRVEQYDSKSRKWGSAESILRNFK